MGWSGYGLYDGDGTQTLHFDFIMKAIPTIKSYNDIFDWLGVRKTKIPKEYRAAFKKGIPNIINNIKKPKRWDEDSAIEWQMLLALLMDNDYIIPRKIQTIGLEACDYLLGDHCDEFDEPSKRKAVIKRFIKKVNGGYDPDLKMWKKAGML